MSLFHLCLTELEGTRVGTLHSGDLVAAANSGAPAPSSIKTARSTPSTAAAIKELNAHAHGSNANSIIQSSINEPGHKRKESSGATQDHSVSEVYSKFVSAVSCSLSHTLGKGQGWIQVGPNACIDARTLGDEIFEDSDSNPSLTTTLKLSFDVKWLSSGTLLISYLLVCLPRLRRLSAMVSKDAHSLELTVGSSLLLSPSGTRCQYLGLESLPNSDVQLKSPVQAKASMLSAYLNHQGIRNIQDIKWIQVLVGHESNVAVSPPISLWPADLCFCEDVMNTSSSADGESFNRSIVDFSTDPLEKVESWFLGKAARMEASQARLREKNERNQATKDVEDSDDEDVLSLFEIPMDQGITPQDVSGIYPTPPDGVPPALLGSSNPNDLQSGEYEDEEKEVQPRDEAHGDYDGQENDDLFGDMDIEMFASNGLTEADFSFFDEPGMIDEDLGETGQIMTLDDTNETIDHPMAFAEQGLRMTAQESRESASIQKIAEDQEDSVGEQAKIRANPRHPTAYSSSAHVTTRLRSSFTDSDQVLQTADISLCVNDYDKAAESTVKIEEVDYGAFEQLNLRHGATIKDAHRGQKGSFEHVMFQKPTSNLDDKYNMQGRFAFDVDELPVHPKNGSRSFHPESGFLGISIFPDKSPMKDSVDTGQLLPFRLNDLLLTFSVVDDEEHHSSVPDGSDSQDAINASLELQAGPSRKRKREQLDENDHPVTPSPSVVLAESLAGSIQDESDEPMSDSSLSKAFKKTNNTFNIEPRSQGRPNPYFTGGKQAFVKVAQVIAHQAVSGLVRSQIEFSEDSNLVGRGVLDRSLQNTMTQLLSTFFPTRNHCSLKDYVSLGEKSPNPMSKEQVSLSQRSLKPTHMTGGLTTAGKSIFKLDSPYACIQRNGVSTEISASALSFWEELSLGPSHETKDIDVFCVCPKNKYIEERVMAFLNMVKGAYQSCNLGSYDLGASLADHSKRIVTAFMDATNPDSLLKNIASTCEGLGTKLPELGLESGTIVIYIINPFKDQQYLSGLGEALLRLSNSYRSALEKRRLERHNDLVTQIVPLDLVWSPEFIVVPSPADYRKLAFEVYDSCGRASDFMRAPAIRLAKALPKVIDFKLVPESSASFMQSDYCVHVSYTWDATNEWLAASWTDNLGILSWVACYYLGKKQETLWKSIYEYVKEILETSFEMLHPPSAPWRLFICKDSPLPKMENDGTYSSLLEHLCFAKLTYHIVWLRALADSSRPSTSCTIITVNDNPLLAFPYSDLQRSSSDLAPGLLATPGATPQTNAPSPDISGLGSTPAGNTAQAGTPPANVAVGDHDSEARLIDATDLTWGVVMDGTLDDLTSLSEKSSSMASGYLIKRAGPRDEDGLIPLGVDLVHGQKPYRAVLKEVLGMYRNLGTLARVRRVVDPVTSVLPLHVAASRKAWKALGETMRYTFE